MNNDLAKELFPDAYPDNPVYDFLLKYQKEYHEIKQLMDTLQDRLDQMDAELREYLSSSAIESIEFNEYFNE